MRSTCKAIERRARGVMPTRPRRNGESGFTLLELIVVVVIIAILASISVPIYLGVRKKAWNTATLSDVKNLSMIVETAAVDLGGDLPSSFEIAPQEDSQTVDISAMQSAQGMTSDMDVEVTLSADVSLCYTPNTRTVDKDGNRLGYTGRTSQNGAGYSNTHSYYIYGTNENNLDVYYMYDSSTGSLTKQENPQKISASSVSHVTGKTVATQTVRQRYRRGGRWYYRYKTVQVESFQVTYCDIETAYGLHDAADASWDRKDGWEGRNPLS